jgi:uncharacterized protein (DUF58 family)
MRAIRDALTARGMAFLAAGVVLVASGTGLGQHDLTRIGLLLLVLPLAGFAFGRRHDLALEVSRVASPTRVHIDDPAHVTMTIRNPGGGRTPLLMAEEQLDYALGDRPRFVLPSMPAGERRQVSYLVRCHTRGRHRLGPLGIRVRDPFGLTSRAGLTGGHGTIVVLPRIHPLSTPRSLGSGIGTEGTVPHMIGLHGEDDQTIREYRDGDDLRRIHWPMTSHTGELMVRQEDRPAQRRAVLLLDTRPGAHSRGARSASFEWAVSMCASVAAHLVAHGYAVHLLTPEPASDLGVAEDDELESVLDTLARIETGSDDGYRPVLHAASTLASQGGLVVALVGGLDDDTARATASLRQPGSTGVAFVLDRSAFDAGHASATTRGSEETTRSMLSTSGWSALTVGPQATPPEAWATAATQGRTAAVR